MSENDFIKEIAEQNAALYADTCGFWVESLAKAIKEKDPTLSATLPEIEAQIRMALPNNPGEWGELPLAYCGGAVEIALKHKTAAEVSRALRLANLFNFGGNGVGLEIGFNMGG